MTKTYFIFLSILSFILTGCDYPHWRLDEYVIEASFDVEGNCSFSVDGKELSSSSYVQRVANWRDSCGGCATDEVDAYMLRCKAKERTRQTSQNHSPTLYVTVAVKRGQQAANQNFQVIKTLGRFDKPGGYVSVLNVPGISNSSLRNGITGVSLVAYEGMISVNELKPLNGQVLKNVHHSGGEVLATIKATASRRANGF